jgi:ribonuclease Z
MKIPITFLGTSQAVPTATRNHTAILLSYKDENILVDCGEGTQRQFRKAKLNPCKLTRLFITHWHGDHVLGIPGLLQTLALNNYSKTLNVYGPKGTRNFMKQLYKIFVPARKIKINVNEISSGKIFENKDFVIYSLPLDHEAPCNGYFFKEKDKLRIKKDKLKKLKIPNIPEIAKLSHGKDIKINNKLIKYKDLTYLEK